jgi:hypothetical protein
LRAAHKKRTSVVSRTAIGALFAFCATSGSSPVYSEARDIKGGWGVGLPLFATIDYVVAPTAADKAAFERMKLTLSQARSAKTFRLVGSCNACKNVGLTLARLPERHAGASISHAGFVRLRAELSSSDSYIFGMNHSCSEPFTPDIGFEFSGETETAVLLIMTSCNWGRLAFQSEIPFYLYNFRENALQKITNEFSGVR